MAITLDPTLVIPGPRNQMTDEEKRMAEIERLVAEQVEKQRTSPSTVGRKTFAPVPGQAVNPNVVPEKFKLQQDMQGNYWNRIQRTEGGPLVIERLSSEYSPADQKKITQLYQARSEAITDPENSPEEKQAFADKFDAMISIVPKMPPMMREPTPQQTFESSIVTDPATQQRGFFDPKSGKFNPLVDPKIAQEENDKFNERFQKNLDIIRKDNADPLRMGEAMDDPSMIDMARAMTDNEMGKTKGRRDTSKPEMDAAWSTTMADLNIDNGFKSKKASEELMLSAMDQYVKMGIGKGMREVDAKADFLQRWESALGGGPYQALVPLMSPETRNKAQVVKAGTVREDDPISQQYGLGRGEGKVTVQNQELPPEVDAVWGSLSNSDKEAVRKALASGANTMQPIERRMIKVEKGGEQFYVPILQIGEAKASGYTVVN